MPQVPLIPIPSDWPEYARTALLYVISTAHWSLVSVRGWCANSPIQRVRLRAEVERLQSEVALLREELRIKDCRLARIDPRRRPHFPPFERLAILALKAARGWNQAQTARRFGLVPATIATWLRRLDEEGESALVRTPTPVNRFPDFVAQVLTQLKLSFPHLGRRRLADLLARAGLHLAATTVRRILNQRGSDAPIPPRPQGSLGERSQKGESSSGGAQPDPGVNCEAPKRVVTANYPGHVWHVDLTLVPILGGFAVPWLPRALLPYWPCCWWVAVVLDHFSRKVVGNEVFRSQPTSAKVCALLDRIVARAGRAPKYVVSDQGTQFREQYRRWCQRRGIRPRFGAIGQYGSVAVIERFMRTLKDEGLRRILLPLSFDAMVEEVRATVDWYNACRPHTALGGATPAEIYEGGALARSAPRYEPRARYPVRGVELRAPPGTRVELVTHGFRGRRHLPVVELRAAA